MNQAALGLCAPVMIGRHLYFTNAVELFAQAGCCQTNGQVENFWSGFGCHGFSRDGEL